MKSLLFLLLLATIFAFPLSAQNASQPSLTNFHEFDFWLGEWEVYKFGTDTLVGYSKIETIIDSLGLRENYRTKNGKYHGTSLNKYNPFLKIWEQFWVDNGGLSLHLKGKREGDKMILEGESAYPKGKVMERISWYDMEDGTVRQVWEQSRDAGSSWKKVFDGSYRKKQ